MKESKKFKDNYNAFMASLISFPLNIPGTVYHACMQGRNNVIKVIKDTIKQRTIHGDFLDHLLDEIKKEETFLNEEIAIDMVFLLLFASYETTSSAITLAI
ncbi:Cytochrome P [Parasponia andersonii]|uniref:Cytochrome P n=1 Tax=Parasponia andersonii TaxID=3476 RepID=A0A2P5CA96_PARAD|nr:Cytochrome P [Parasponia andersonii]